MRRFGSGRSDWLGLAASVWPGQAELAILVALKTFETESAGKEQVGDLADAIDAYCEKSFYVAKVLAEAAVTRRKLPAGRPSDLSQTLTELNDRFRHARRAMREFPGDDRD